VAVLIRPALRLEWRFDRRHHGAEARQHLFQHVIVPHPQTAADDLHFGVAIAEVPGKARQGYGIGSLTSRDFYQRLRLRDDGDGRTVIQQKPVAVAQRCRFREIEQELEPALTGQHDAPAVALIGIEHDPVDGIGRAPRAGAQYRCGTLRGADARKDFGRHQNRKYLCAIGSTSAGAQVKSSPSAFTS
jgi:hypothetical protein